MTHDEMIRVLEAHRDGKPIEARVLDHAFRQRTWMQVTASPDCRWQFDQFEYRVKPEPLKPRDFWIRRPSPSAGLSSIWLDATESMPVDPAVRDNCIHVREVIE